MHQAGSEFVGTINLQLLRFLDRVPQTQEQSFVPVRIFQSLEKDVVAALVFKGRIGSVRKQKLGESKIFASDGTYQRRGTVLGKSKFYGCNQRLNGTYWAEFVDVAALLQQLGDGVFLLEDR